MHYKIKNQGITIKLNTENQNYHLALIVGFGCVETRLCELERTGLLHFITYIHIHCSRRSSEQEEISAHVHLRRESKVE